MGFRCGIIGLPNVGKSTLFNALTRTSAAQAENYPFCTIEPNIGEVDVPDKRLEVLSKLNKSERIIPARLTFVDIAGLVKGASQGEGLGNQFLSNIKEVDAVAHVIRCFEDDNITHVNGKIDPIKDIEIIETELLLSDISNLEKRQVSLEKKAKSNDKDSKENGSYHANNINGIVTIFPPTLAHYTTPNVCKTPRYSLAMDVFGESSGLNTTQLEYRNF